MNAQKPARTPFSTTSFHDYKVSGTRIVACTAYDVVQARVAAAAGVDWILVGDSMGNTTLGFDSSLFVTMDDMVRATAAVKRGAPDTYVAADLPFMSYQADYTEGMHNAARLMTEGGAQAVKLEGATADTLTLVEGLTGAGIPVIGHLGLTPQSVNTLGGYKVQAKEPDAIVQLLVDAHLLMEAGAVALVLECIPAEVAQQVTEVFDIATIGIGAGPHCDGEIQVLHDLLGLGGTFKPRHAKRYVEVEALMREGLTAYADEARGGTFPGPEQATHIEEDIVEAAAKTFVAFILEAMELEQAENDEDEDAFEPPDFLGDFGAHLN
jgi:3-methyl-2-oxobutanoate hydroxymethyltransferase